ncbi:TPA: hypothetical protein ACKP5F_005770 [Pseudomonas aeruginosa]|nr:hypothetical protein [Pseudomonas aeruginosa]
MSPAVMPICEFCQKQAVLTKEHLWPAALHKRLYTINQQSRKIFWLSKIQREIPSEPQIRDVCAECNNVVLSKLDDYICRLFDSTFKNVVRRFDEVVFEYDYHLLKRWLLKISFNSAKVHNSPDRLALERVLPYILGADLKMGRSIQLFVQLSHPQDIYETEFKEDGDPNKKVLVEPLMHRLGHVIFRAHGIGEKILRAVYLRSYVFYLAYWLPGGGNAEQSDFAEIFGQGMRGIRLLRPSEERVKLLCDGVGAWDSLKDSRSNQFSSDVEA